MNIRQRLQGLVSMGLAAALFLCPVTQVLAAEVTEETVFLETIPTVEETTASQEMGEALTEETTPTEEVTEPKEETEPAEEPTEPAETTEETQSEEMTQPALPQETVPVAELATPSVLTVAQALDLSPNTREITIRGTVVYAMGVQAVLQDSTGGIRLSFSEDPGVAPGQILQVTGRRSAGLFVSDFELLGTGNLPAVETTLLDAPEELRVLIRGATLRDGQLRHRGFSMQLSAELPREDTAVDVAGVILDGRFYADSIVPATVPTAAVSAEETEDWNLYFGLLHAHTNISDGKGTVEEAFGYASEVPYLDFFAVTDHSDSFDDADAGSIREDGTRDPKENPLDNDWSRGKAAAAAVTDETFVGIYGYEMSWPEDRNIGHISTFNTPGWQTWKQPGFRKLGKYFEALARVPDSVSQFNHPGNDYGFFQKFTDYKPAYDRVMHLIEVGSEGDTRYYDAYTMALDKHWHLAPSFNQNNHNGHWGDESTVRTVVLAKQLTEEAIYDAIRNYRVYATEDSDLEIRYTLNGADMGTILGPVESVEIQVSLADDTDGTENTLVEVIANGGKVVAGSECGADGELSFSDLEQGSYYYLRITQPDGHMAVTAPVWIDNYEDIKIESFSPDNESPTAGEEVEFKLTLSNEEWVDLVLEKIEILADGQLLHTLEAPGTLGSMKTRNFYVTHSRETAGESVIAARVTGTVAGTPWSDEWETLLYYQPKEPLVTSISSARSGVPGLAYHIKGYVTAGNSNPYNTFSRTLYLQDDTGGIAVTGNLPSGIQIGAPLSAVGILRKQGGNLVLEATKFTLSEEAYFRFTPRAMSNSTATDYASNGGELIQVEGTLVSLTKSGKSVSRFTLQDLRGDLVTVVIEDNIRSGAYGTNELAGTLKKGRTIRAVGILHVDEFQQSVLRVRNCDEIVYVPPKADPTNPRTGDWFWFLR